MSTRTVCVHITGSSPYSASKAHAEPKLDASESIERHDERTWLSKMYVDPKGQPYIPPMAFKWALGAAAKMLSLQIPGKGKATYTKFFETGVMVIDPVIIAKDVSAVRRDRVHVNSDGVRGSGSRVWRFFPVIESWDGVVTVHLLAPEIPKEVFEKVMVQAGVFIGVGRFRPEKGGFYGRFVVEQLDWAGGLAKAA